MDYRPCVIALLTGGVAIRPHFTHSLSSLMLDKIGELKNRPVRPIYKNKNGVLEAGRGLVGLDLFCNSFCRPRWTDRMNK